MASITYYNGYTANSSRDVDLYDVNGRQVMQIWTNPMSFDTHYRRRQYFANPHDEHCLSVEMDVVDDVKCWIFFYDDQPANIEPVNVLPDNDTLIGYLENYG
jgi:hypothetical protein